MRFEDPPAPETVKEAKEQIFESPEFSSNIQDELVTMFIEFLGNLSDRFGQLLDTSPLLAWLLLGGLVVVLVVLTAHMLITVAREVGSIRSIRTRSENGNAEVVALEGRAKSFDEAVAIVQSAIHSNDMRTAIWVLHRLLLGILDDKGALSFAGWKTNDDYLSECSSDHPDYLLLRELTDVYETIIYAHNDTVSAPLQDLLQATRAARGVV